MSYHLLGSMSGGRRVPAVTVFGWDDVLCPTTQAKMDRGRHTTAKEDFGFATARNTYRLKEVCTKFDLAVDEEKGWLNPSRDKDRRRKVGKSCVTFRLSDHPPEWPRLLLKVGASVVRCIQAAQRHGPVVIVTESGEQWVRGTARLLLPGTWGSCLEDVEIVSSRERFGDDFPGQPACWHIAAFSYVTNRHLLAETAPAGLEAEEEGELGDRVSCDCRGGGGGGEDPGARNLNKDGNSERGCGGCGGAAGKACSAPQVANEDARSEEMRGRGTLVAVATTSCAWQDKSATRTLREHHPEIVAKTVSLIEGPTLLELRNQLDLLSESFEMIFGHQQSRPGPALFRSPSASGTSFLSKSRHYLPGGEGGESCLEDDDPGPGRYFDDNATVISSSSEKSADDEEDAF